MKILRTRRGARLVDGPDVLSEILSAPGPTHGLFDVLAACAAGLAPGPRLAVLGFAGGGVVAPLRALGFTSRIDAVDISRDGEALFRELSRAWCGDVRLAQADAAAWLRRRRGGFDIIVEDLTVPTRGGAVKPTVSVEILPELMHARLRPRGAAVVNVLPMPGMSWSALLRQLAAPFAQALVVVCHDYENRILLAGDALAPGRQVSTRLRDLLRRLRSRQRSRFDVAALSRPAPS